ncbi:MAG: LysM peptidoglycan-binding domain-containing protein [Oscillospiraceae bacterium]|nr:LysM peptidoglycan-binding domain-containing protein [Oscillospiraceae bacterium]
MTIYTVSSGDSVYSISTLFQVSPAEIISANGLQSPEKLVPGQSLVIPTERITLITTAGDTLYSIAQKYKVTVFDILSANPEISDPNSIAIGQKIQIPFTNKKIYTLYTNGYALTNISSSVLNTALPFLSYVTLFSLEASPDGSLTLPPNFSQTAASVRSANVVPLAAVTNLDSAGGFNSETAHAILNDMTAQANLIKNIVNTLKQYSLGGVDMDIEYVYAQDREAYNTFLLRLSSELRSNGFVLATAVAPKTSSTQRGILYEGHDYSAHGEYADHVTVMTYEWGYSMGPPMAVAPLDQVERVIKYAVSQIPSQKIFMGIPNYGYDWTLPYTSGRAALTISNTGAVAIAAEYGAEIQFDEKSQTPYFYYTDKSGSQHVVWFEDARSIYSKLLLAAKYNLGGVSYWTINRPFPQNWEIISSFFNIKK